MKKYRVSAMCSGVGGCVYTFKGITDAGIERVIGGAGVTRRSNRQRQYGPFTAAEWVVGAAVVAVLVSPPLRIFGVI